MVKQTRARQVVRFALVATALLLPSATLVPLGGLYLWERGYLTPWAIAIAAAFLIVYLLHRWLTSEVATAPRDDNVDMSRTRSFTAVEDKAWADVRRIASSVDLDRFYTAEAMLDVAHRTINAVAYRIHADKTDALWRFTLPEALAIIGRVSERLNVFVTENIPFGDSLTVSQVRQAYRWRSLADAAERAYDVWRVVRLANPATAVTHEARERLSRAMLQWGREHMARRLAEAFVEEVGRAAIDLYTGRLRMPAETVRPFSQGVDKLEEHAMLPALSEISIAVVGEDSKSISEILGQLQVMEDRRKVEVRAFMSGRHALAAYLRRPRLVTKPASADAGQSSRSSNRFATAANTLLVLLVKQAGAEITATDTKIVQQLDGADEVVAPVLMPVVNGRSEPATRDEGVRSRIADHLRSGLYSGCVADPLQIGTANSFTAEEEEAFWNSVESVSDQLRRIQFIRVRELSKSSRSWLGAARQAASALGRLARHIRPISR